MNTKVGMSIHNEFKFKVVDAKTGKVKQEAISHNMVLDGFFTNICQAYVSNRYIQKFWIGQGTGTLDPARTKLFTYLFNKNVTAGDSAILDEGLNRKIYTATLTELESVGSISEIGLGDNGTTSTYRIFTHSLITDSEGNPITINKTDADILYITATVWSKITSPPESKLKFIRAFSFAPDSLYSTDVTDANAKPGATAASAVLCPLIFSSLTATSLTQTAGTAYLSALTKPLHTQGAGVCLGGSSTATELTALAGVAMTKTSISNTVVRCTTSQILSTNGNPGEGSVLIKSIMLGQIGVVTFPDHDVYPPKALTLTATASGSDTEFNFPIAELMVAGAQVYVNGVLQDPSTYTLNGKNFEYAQAWASQDNKYIKSYNPVKESSSMFVRYQPVYPARVTVPTGCRSITYRATGKAVDPWVWDFQTPKAVNCFANGYLQLATTAGSLVLESSEDEVTWTPRATLSNAVSIVNFEVVTARYWRVRGNLETVSETIVYSSKGFLGAFDEKKPQLVLNNPPAAGAVVKLVANCEYPMKNANWRIDPIVADITITRGTEG